MQSTKPMAKKPMIKPVVYLSVLTIMEDKLRKSLQETCDKTGTYPSRILKNSKGFTILFFQPQQPPECYSFMNKIFEIVNNLKLALNVSTVMIQRGSVKVATEPSVIKEIAKLKSQQVSEKNEMIKRLEEDIEIFTSHVKSQIEDSDYDSREGRAADMQAIKHERRQKKGVGYICPEGQGQMSFDLSIFQS